MVSDKYYKLFKNAAKIIKDSRDLNKLYSGVNSSKTNFDVGNVADIERDFNRLIDKWRIYSNYEDVQVYIGEKITVHTLNLKGDKNYDVD